MTISFVIENDELLMCYKPAYGAEEILSQLKKGEEKRIKNTFCVSNESLKRIEDEYEESFYFVMQDEPVVLSLARSGVKIRDKHLLTEIPKHMDDTDLSFLDSLLPWSKQLPADCRKKKKTKSK